MNAKDGQKKGDGSVDRQYGTGHDTEYILELGRGRAGIEIRYIKELANSFKNLEFNHHMELGPVAEHHQTADSAVQHIVITLFEKLASRGLLESFNVTHEWDNDFEEDIVYADVIVKITAEKELIAIQNQLANEVNEVDLMRLSEDDLYFNNEMGILFFGERKCNFRDKTPTSRFLNYMMNKTELGQRIPAAYLYEVVFEEEINDFTHAKPDEDLTTRRKYLRDIKQGINKRISKEFRTQDSLFKVVENKYQRLY